MTLSTGTDSKIEDLLSFLLRLMSNYVCSPSTDQIHTLLQAFKHIRKHPDYSANQTVRVAVEQADLIWKEQLRQHQRHEAHCCVKRLGKLPVH